MHEDTDAIQSLRCPLYVQSQLKLVTESCLSRSRVTSLESTFGCFWARYGFGEQCGTYTKNCNFGRGNDDRPLELRGNYLLSDTAMMVISHADVVRECLISEDPPNPCCVGFPSSKWSFRVLHLKFLVYKPWPVLTVNVSYLLYQVYDMSRFSMKCSVSVCSSCSGYISHMFLVKKCFFRRLASRLFLLQCCGVLGRLTCSSAIPWVLR